MQQVLTLLSAIFWVRPTNFLRALKPTFVAKLMITLVYLLALWVLVWLSMSSLAAADSSAAIKAMQEVVKPAIADSASWAFEVCFRMIGLQALYFAVLKLIDS